MIFPIFNLHDDTTLTEYALAHHIHYATLAIRTKSRLQAETARYWWRRFESAKIRDRIEGPA